jgi:hypothetical protein
MTLERTTNIKGASKLLRAGIVFVTTALNGGNVILTALLGFLPRSDEESQDYNATPL